MNERRDYISVQNLTHRYPNTSQPALDGVDLQIMRGSTFGLLGPNGAGKSTLLAILTGVIRAQSGEVRIADRNLASDADAIKSMSALVPQDYAFYPSLTARENLRFFADVYGLTKAQFKERLQQCVDICLLGEVIDRRAEHFSGGLKRRLNLSIGLLAAPQLLYLDEPTVGIDAKSRACIIDAIATLKTTGATIVYTSHYMEEVEALCDDIVVIDQGRVIMRERLDELLRAASRQTLRIVFKSPASPSLQQALAKWSADFKSKMECVLIVENNEIETVLAAIHREHAAIDRLFYGVSRLHDIYLKLLENQS